MLDRVAKARHLLAGGPSARTGVFTVLPRSTGEFWNVRDLSLHSCSQTRLELAATLADDLSCARPGFRCRVETSAE